MVVSCVFKKLQEEDGDSNKEVVDMNALQEDEELMNDPVLKLGKRKMCLFSERGGGFECMTSFVCLCHLFLNFIFYNQSDWSPQFI